MSEKLENGIDILVGLAVLELLIKTSEISSNIKNSRTAWPATVNATFYFLRQLCSRHACLTKKVLIILRLGLGCSSAIMFAKFGYALMFYERCKYFTLMVDGLRNIIIAKLITCITINRI